MNTETISTLFFIEMYKNEPREIWRKTISNMDILAGMIAAGIGIVGDINNPLKDRFHIMDTDVDISSYRIHHYISQLEINNKSCAVLNKNEYGIWLKSDMYGYYSLYHFKNENFIQGILSICKSFNVDPRDYIFGLPFDLNNNHYYLLGRIDPYYNYATDVPDLDDVDLEEFDNEYMIESFVKDY